METKINHELWNLLIQIAKDRKIINYWEVAEKINFWTPRIGILILSQYRFLQN